MGAVEDGKYRKESELVLAHAESREPQVSRIRHVEICCKTMDYPFHTSLRLITSAHL